MNITIRILLFLLAAWCLAAQQGPRREGSETVAKPRPEASKDQGARKEAEQPKIPSQFKRRPGEEPPSDLTFRTDVLTVTVDVAVLDNRGRFIPGIPAQNFRILEDNVPQKIVSFSQGEAPMTVAMVIEFSNLFQQYWTETWYQTLQAAYGFLETLRQEDYVAIVAYDIRPEILCDFTTNKQEAYDAMRRLTIAAYSEANLFDALVDTAERMSEIEGRKAIVLISSGMDTFSKLTFGEARKRVREAGVPVYAIGLMQALRDWYDARGYLGPIARLDFLQADNQMRTFANESGGQAFFPRFYGEFPGIFNAIAQSMRNQYSLAYQPTNQARDGSYRRIKVELIDPATGQPLRVVDEKNRPIKYKIIAKSGYTAPRPVE